MLPFSVTIPGSVTPTSGAKKPQQQWSVTLQPDVFALVHPVVRDLEMKLHSHYLSRHRAYHFFNCYSQPGTA